MLKNFFKKDVLTLDFGVFTSFRLPELLSSSSDLFSKSLRTLGVVSCVSLALSSPVLLALEEEKTPLKVNFDELTIPTAFRFERIYSDYNELKKVDPKTGWPLYDDNGKLLIAEPKTPHASFQQDAASKLENAEPQSWQHYEHDTSLKPGDLLEFRHFSLVYRGEKKMKLIRSENSDFYDVLLLKNYKLLPTMVRLKDRSPIPFGTKALYEELLSEVTYIDHDVSEDRSYNRIRLQHPYYLTFTHNSPKSKLATDQPKVLETGHENYGHYLCHGSSVPVRMQTNQLKYLWVKDAPIMPFQNHLDIDNLRVLYCDYRQLKALKSCPELKSLSIYDHFEPEEEIVCDLLFLKNSPKLEKIVLTAYYQYNLPGIHLPKLKRLVYHTASISKEQIEAFKALNPQCVFINEKNWLHHLTHYISPKIKTGLPANEDFEKPDWIYPQELCVCVTDSESKDFVIYKIAIPDGMPLFSTTKPNVHLRSEMNIIFYNPCSNSIPIEMSHNKGAINPRSGFPFLGEESQSFPGDYRMKYRGEYVYYSEEFIRLISTAFDVTDDSGWLF